MGYEHHWARHLGVHATDGTRAGKFHRKKGVRNCEKAVPQCAVTRNPRRRANLHGVMRHGRPLLIEIFKVDFEHALSQGEQKQIDGLADFGAVIDIGLSE